MGLSCGMGLRILQELRNGAENPRFAKPAAE